VHGVPVSISTDRGATWKDGGRLAADDDALGLTDLVKGYRQYWLRFHTSKNELAKHVPTIRTVCQMNSSLVPRLNGGKNEITYAASGHAVVSAGPTLAQARAHKIAGDFNTPKLTLALAAPRQAKATTVYAAAHMRSSSPPDPGVSYFIEYSLDEGKSWQPIVRDWKITRRGDEPKDFWSQSFVWGKAKLPQPTSGAVQVRFRNTGGKQIARAEMHLAYEVPHDDACEITFGVTQGANQQARVQTLSAVAQPGSDKFTIDAGEHSTVKWVEMRPRASR
jgi:hypothetical protein